MLDGNNLKETLSSPQARLMVARMEQDLAAAARTAGVRIHPYVEADSLLEVVACAYSTMACYSLVHLLEDVMAATDRELPVPRREIIDAAYRPVLAERLTDLLADVLGQGIELDQAVAGTLDCACARLRVPADTRARRLKQAVDRACSAAASLRRRVSWTYDR